MCSVRSCREHVGVSLGLSGFHSRVCAGYSCCCNNCLRAFASAGHEKIAQSLADPEQYDNLFEGHSAALAAESYLRRRRGADLERSASDWDASLMPAARDPLAEMEEGGASSQEARVRSSARDSPPPPPRSDVNGGPPKAALGSGSDGGGGGVGGGGGIEDFERELERDLEDLELGRDSPHRSSSGGAGAGGGGGDEDDLDLDDDFEDFA